MTKKTTKDQPKRRAAKSPAAAKIALQIDARRLKLRNKARACIAMLSPAERAVFDKMLEGKSAREIGEELDRSTFTISNHTRRIFSAFGLTSRSAVIAMLVVPIDADVSNPA